MVLGLLVPGLLVPETTGPKRQLVPGTTGPRGQLVPRDYWSQILVPIMAPNKAKKMIVYYHIINQLRCAKTVYGDF